MLGLFLARYRSALVRIQGNVVVKTSREDAEVRRAQPGYGERFRVSGLGLSLPIRSRFRFGAPAPSTMPAASMRSAVFFDLAVCLVDAPLLLLTWRGCTIDLFAALLGELDVRSS